MKEFGLRTSSKQRGESEETRTQGSRGETLGCILKKVMSPTQTKTLLDLHRDDLEDVRVRGQLQKCVDAHISNSAVYIDVRFLSSPSP